MIESWRIILEEDQIRQFEITYGDIGIRIWQNLLNETFNDFRLTPPSNFIPEIVRLYSRLLRLASFDPEEYLKSKRFVSCFPPLKQLRKLIR